MKQSGDNGNASASHATRFASAEGKNGGQFNTPSCVVRCLVEMLGLYEGRIYDCACGTGGMLTVAEETLQQIAKDHRKQVATHLYGQEINGETYAICKADLLLKGDGDAADNIIGGPAFSTLSNDQFRSRAFDFMLANPPYGKSWKSDLERMSGEGSKKDVKDPRFIIEHAGDPEYSLITRSSDGQMLFLANMLSKMKHDTPLGSRIAEVHNGSSLFTGDAGQGDSDEDDEEGDTDTPKKSLSDKKKKKLLSEATWKRDAQLLDIASKLRKALGDKLFEYHNVFLEKVDATLKDLDLTPSASELKLIVNAVSWRVEDAPRVIKKIHKPGKTKPDPLHGLFEANIGGQTCVVEYEPDSELRDFEQIPLLEEGGIGAFIRREVLPYTPDAWIVEADTKIGYEVSFTRHFYQPPQLRTLDQISADILALEQETKGLLGEIVKGKAK